MYHIGSYHVKYFTTKNIIIQVTIIPPKTIHLSYRERERKKVIVVDSSLVHYRIIAKIFNDEGEGGWWQQHGYEILHTLGEVTKTIALPCVLRRGGVVEGCGGGEVKGCGEGRPVVNPSTGEKDHHLVYLAEKNIYADFFYFCFFII